MCIHNVLNIDCQQNSAYTNIIRNIQIIASEHNVHRNMLMPKDHLYKKCTILSIIRMGCDITSYSRQDDKLDKTMINHDKTSLVVSGTDTSDTFLLVGFALWLKQTVNNTAWPKKINVYVLPLKTQFSHEQVPLTCEGHFVLIS